LGAALAFAAQRSEEGLLLLGGRVPYAFVLFVLVLLGVALFHRHALLVAAAGAVVISVYTVWLSPGFSWSSEQHQPGLWGHFLHEGEHTLLNLGGLLLGFALLARYFEGSGVPDHLPHLLPRSKQLAAFTLLAMVWCLSAILDNIAATMIGGVVARHAFAGRVTVGYIAAIVAAANAGGAGSVLGDTTTTMMWIDGIPATTVMPAFLAAAVALVVGGWLASRLQNRFQQVEIEPVAERDPIDKSQLVIVVMILAGAIWTNVQFDKPFLGVWIAILLGALWRRPAWGELPSAAKGAAFLLSLVWCASLMPVESLPAPSWQTTFGLGFVSSVFDNIPLTKLALEQGGYDWAMLAYAVGYGGSMIWFGSSAGVAISGAYPEARNAGRYLKEGWPVILAYVAGFVVMLLVLGWRPSGPHS
jgi:Na+/H+ antiporter NhaD/arsenite permease-like protein